ncbi:MAG TPA: ABC transporter permease [Terracidiphilus sp.]|jgi:predicted permease|nr:ABC transporter permease [Terracidiphilus sp.]
MSNLWNELKHALRSLLKNPAFTIAAVSALALGIGVNTAIFSVVDAVLLKPLAYPNADRIVEFGFHSPILASFRSSVPKFHAYQRLTGVFQEVAAYDMAGPGFNLTGGRPEQVQGIHVTEGYFRLFGAPLLLGRTFTQQEDSPNGGKVVVLSYGLWQSRFAGDPNIVGKSLSLGNEPYTIVGVTGKQFRSDPEADLWLPFQFPPVSHDMNSYFRVAGLLRPGITLAQANAQLELAAIQYHRDYPQTSPRQRFRVQPLRDSIVGDVRNSLLVLLGAVSLVLLIACTNVVNLLLARATGRKREFAIRSALGAGRSRIIRQLLTESILLSVIGGSLGLALGFAGVRALLAISPPDLPRIGEGGSAVGLDWRVLGFTLAVSLATGILFGLFPALNVSRADLNAALKEGSNRSGTGFRQGRMRSMLVISEISLALVLLVSATLLIHTFIALHGVGPGFDPHNVLTMEMSLTGDRFEKTAGVIQLEKDGRERLNALPGVEVSAAAYWLPIQVGDALPFQIVGQPTDKDHEYGSQWMSVSPGYLSVFRIPVLRGRGFNEDDTATSPEVVLINEAMASKYWPHKDPIGQQIHISSGLGPEMDETTPTIVGVVADSHNDGLGHPPGPMVMVPVTQVTDKYTVSYTNVQPMIWVVRTRVDPNQMIAAVTEQLRLASGGFPVAHVRTMDEVMAGSTDRASFNMLLLIIFGAAALILAAIGIYSLMAYSVAQRTQEMGIRMALGADRSAIRRLVVWHGVKLAAAGVALGLGTAFPLTHLIASFLFGVKPWDPTAFLVAPLILIVVALIAVWLPATRASKVDPIQALRAE